MILLNAKIYNVFVHQLLDIEFALFKKIII